MKLLSLFLSFSILLSCSSIHFVEENELNTILIDKDVKIKTKKYFETIQTKNIRINSDSTSWYNSRLQNQETYVNSDIEEISTSNHIKGALQGMGFGAAIGMIIGGIVASTQKDSDSPLDEISKTSIFMIWSASGTLVGALIGGVKGSSDIYKFETRQVIESK
ncbi:MAG: glycine zipper family protein [Calditrichaceae bacterium]|nr:glycine zipper family protein [Calditrichaceae bacterium]MBN2710582.1 glycine zipper family protein [Calditrichaceae bacterium]RQV94124.1 MAG: glycine zipper family protein [Calditrichota bacterium]